MVHPLNVPPLKLWAYFKSPICLFLKKSQNSKTHFLNVPWVVNEKILARKGLFPTREGTCI